MLARRVFTCLALVAIATTALGQESPQPDGPAVDAASPTSFEFEEASEEYTVRNRNGQLETKTRSRRIPAQTYYSPNLKASFRAEWMYLDRNGSRTNFWGARIAHLDFNSPLNALGVVAGDVITRLDGVGISSGMYRESGRAWQIVELENHYSLTEVRFVIHNNPIVRSGQINLDPSPPGDDFDGGGALPP
jgi:hypothetical protein